MKDVIKKIYKGEDLQEILDSVLLNVFSNGPISSTDMEILSLMSHYQPEFLKPYLNSILSELALNYKKDVVPQTLADEVFTLYKEDIIEKTGISYTPVQADILTNVQENHYVSISAPTSTGKSFVLHNLIKDCPNDVVVVVPSRALINEYFTKLREEIPDKSVNILTFIDKINTEHCRKSIFVVTPERCRELFKRIADFDIGLLLFDEAQLGDEKGVRGIYFDSIIRRCKRNFPKAKFVFAHPFIANPEAQLVKNGFDESYSFSRPYIQKNVGQMFYCRKSNGCFALFGIDKDIMGTTILNVDNDPIVDVLANNGCVLIYTSKNKIINGDCFFEYRKYLSMCPLIEGDGRDEIIQKLKDFTGGGIERHRDYYSNFISLLRRGIVTHHGSLPLKVRLVIEDFMKKGFCKICFATSTLEQGVNMPFDLVFLDRLEGSKPLAVKNLIGRAGRSTQDFKFDYGIVIIKHSSLASFRKIFLANVPIKDYSELDTEINEDDDYQDFKESIRNGSFNDEFNLTDNQLRLLTEDSVNQYINNIIHQLFNGNELLPRINLMDPRRVRYLQDNFSYLYSTYLQRELLIGERGVLDTAIRIMLLRFEGLTFKQICKERFDYIAQVSRRRSVERTGEYINPIAKFTNKFQNIPDIHIHNIPLFGLGTRAEDVDYDRVMYDTYDYIDKLIGFGLSDIFYAAFFKYYQRTQEPLALKTALYIKYGTDNQRKIFMLRYGLDFEDIKELDKHIDSIDETHITVKDSFYQLDEEKRQVIERFL